MLLGRVWRSGVLHMLVSLTFVQGLTFATQVAAARFLSVADFGTVRVIETFLLITFVPAGLGMITVIVKAAAETPDEQQRHKLLFNALLLTSTASLIASLALQAVFPLLGFTAQTSAYLALTAWLLAAMNISRVGVGYFQGLKQIQRMAATNIWFSLIAFALTISGAASGGLSGWAIGRIAGQCLFAAAIVWTLRAAIRPKIDLRLLKSLAGLGTLTGLAYAVDSIASSADVLYLEQLLNNTQQVGVYGAANIVIVGGLLLPLAISSVAFPHLAEHAADRPRLLATARTTLMRTTLVMLPISVGLYLCAPLLTWVIGEAYAPAVPLLQIMCLGLLPSAVRLVLSTWLFAIGRPNGSSLANVLGIVVNLGAIVWLVPIMGITGAAWAFVMTTVARLLAFALALRWIYQTDKKQIRQIC